MNNSPDELHNCCSFRIQLIKSSQSLTVMLVLKSLEMEVNHFKPAHFMIPVVQNSLIRCSHFYVNTVWPQSYDETSPWGFLLRNKMVILSNPSLYRKFFLPWNFYTIEQKYTLVRNWRGKLWCIAKTSHCFCITESLTAIYLYGSLWNYFNLVYWLSCRMNQALTDTLLLANFISWCNLNLKV